MRGPGPTDAVTTGGVQIEVDAQGELCVRSMTPPALAQRPTTSWPSQGTYQTVDLSERHAAADAKYRWFGRKHLCPAQATLLLLRCAFRAPRLTRRVIAAQIPL